MSMRPSRQRSTNSRTKCLRNSPMNSIRRIVFSNGIIQFPGPILAPPIVLDILAVTGHTFSSRRAIFLRTPERSTRLDPDLLPTTGLRRT